MIKKYIKYFLEIFLGKDYFKNRRAQNQSKLLFKLGVDALNRYNSVSKKLNFHFIPMFGTLLGAYRENDFIAFDDDIDMGLDIRYLSNNLIYALRDEGFEIDRIYISSNRRGVQLPMKYQGLTCDIYFLYKDNDIYHTYLPLALKDYGWTYSRKINIFRYKDVVVPYVDDFVNVPFHGKQIEIPSNSEKILARIYGEDFMIPKKNAHADPLINEISIYDKFYNCYPVDFCISNGVLDKLSLE